MATVLYKELSEFLLDLAKTYRPIILFTVSSLASYIENPGNPHWIETSNMLNIFRELQKLKFCIVLMAKAVRTCLAAAKRTFGGNHFEQKGTSEWLFLLEGGAMS